MTQLQRPAYLNNAPDLSERAVQGMGSVLPPHVSIRGNKFTLVDGAGNKKVLGDTMDFLVADINEHGGKMYYANPQWTPDSDDPPTCWSSNGIGPSKDAMTPQARTCAECKHNERGSRISAMGSSVKACRDEVLTAIVHPDFPKMLFKLTITPGSFKNWRKHIEECKNISPQDHVGTVLTRATFDPEQSGVVVFKAVSYPTEATFGAKMTALQAKATDVLVGRNDVPRALPVPATQQEQQRPLPQATGPAPNAGFQSTATAPQLTQSAAPAQAASPSEGPKRRGPKRKEAPADGGFGGTAPAQPQMAPFRPEAPAQANGGAQFGINPNPPGPSAEIEDALNNAFGAPSGGGGTFGQ